MPYKIPGQPGTWYEPGTRKGNATIVWRGQLPDGTWTELVTDATNRAGAEAYRRRAIERWHRDRPPAAGTAVDLDTAVHHYKAAAARSDVERARADRLVRYLGAGTSIAARSSLASWKLSTKGRNTAWLAATANACAARAPPPLPAGIGITSTSA